MKRRQKTPLKPATIILSITVCCAVCLAGIGYVWAKSQLYSLGREMKSLELRVEELKRENAALRQRYAAMCSPRELDAAVRRLSLGIAAPRPDQIVRLPEPLPHEVKRYASNRSDGQ